MRREKVISSLVYKFIERFAIKGIGLFVGIVLARLISPEDFGQLAILSVFISLSQTIIQSGFSTALVQNKDVTEDDYSTVFYISMGISAGLIVVLFVTAPFISEYYGGSALIAPLRFYSFSLLFGAFNSIQVAKLQREMRFKATMICSLLATILSGILGVAMAYMGWGLWALVGYNFAHVIFSSIVMLFSVKWYPRLVFSVSRAKVLFGYGWKLLVSGVLCSLYADLRSLVIGKKFSAEALGYYNRGQQIPQIIAMTTDNAVQSVMLPVLSEAQDEKYRLKAILKRSMAMEALLIIPAMVGLALVAEPIVRLLYTETWLPCVPYMQWLCLAEVFAPVISSGLIAIKAMGRSDVYMKLEIVRRIMMVIVLAISVFCFYSVSAIAVGYFISQLLDAIIVAIPIWKLLGYSLFEQCKDLWKTFFATAGMGLVVLALNFISIHIVLKLIVQIVVGILAYLILNLALKNDSLLCCVSKAKILFNRKR